MFFAGHGLDRELPTGSERGYLVPHDGESRVQGPAWESLYGMNRLADLSEAIPARHVLFVLDCCFSGSVLKETLKPLAPRSLHAGTGDNLSRVFNRRAFQVITSGAGDETVADAVAASKAYSELQQDSPIYLPLL